MEKKEELDPVLQKKLNSIQYRHVNKKLNGKIKYYYSMKPGFYTSIKAPITDVKGKNIVTITMKTGSTYTGEINSNYERHGYGVYEVIKGGTYDGYWKDGFKHGINTFFLKQKGKGAFYYRDGTLEYEGDWQCGEPHGQGKVYNMKGGLAYEGKFVNGKSSSGIYWLDYKNKQGERFSKKF